MLCILTLPNTTGKMRENHKWSEKKRYGRGIYWNDKIRNDKSQFTRWTDGKPSGKGRFYILTNEPSRSFHMCLIHISFFRDISMHIICFANYEASYVDDRLYHANALKHRTRKKERGISKTKVKDFLHSARVKSAGVIDANRGISSVFLFYTNATKWLHISRAKRRKGEWKIVVIIELDRWPVDAIRVWTLTYMNDVDAPKSGEMKASNLDISIVSEKMNQVS